MRRLGTRPATRARQAALIAAVALLAPAALAFGTSAPDHYLCYKAVLAKGQAKMPKGLTSVLEDALAGPQAFALVKITAVCNPADRDGSGIAHAPVHLEGLAIKVQKGGPKFVKSDHVTVDAFAERALTVTAPAVLLDVTPQASGVVPPAPFGSDPTSDPTVNRFKCYKAKLAKGSPKFAPPPSPTVSDDFFVGGQQLVVVKVTKLCEAVDADGATPGAATRPTSLVCYGVKLPRQAPKLVKMTIATNDARVAPQVLVASAPAELCVPASQPTATPTVSPTPTLSSTPTVSATPTPSPTVVPTPGKRVFVTSTTTDGAFGGTSGADTICADRATAAGLGGTFKAWISVTGDGPSTRFTQSAAPYGLADGTIVANDWNDLTDGTLAHAIDVDESGHAVGVSDVWTSTTTGGDPTVTNCNNFLNNTAGVAAVCGNTGLKNSGWTNASTPACNFSLRLYCFEQ